MAALASVNQVLESLQANPFGADPSDPKAGLAMNQGSEYVKCFVRNWSANRERRFITEHISWLKGGERAAKAAKLQGEDFELDKKRKEAYLGQNPSVTEVAIKPVSAILQFDSQQFIVPASDNAKKDPEWVPIPQGVFDLYYGNWERLNSTDAKERALEAEAVAIRRRDVCLRMNKGQNTNEFGFLEFKREIIPHQSIAIDSDMVFSDSYVEV